MKNKENVINLETYRVETAKVFTGRDRGLFVRNESHIDEIEAKFDEVEIIIPDNIYSINPSFFEELFFNVVNKLGKINFLNKFIFTNLGEYNYVKPLNEAIERILRTKTAIG
jgi:hypothetical protein